MRRDEKIQVIAFVLGTAEVHRSKNKREMRGEFVIYSYDLEYLEWIAKLLHSFCGGKYPEINEVGQNLFVLTKKNKYFRVLRNYLYYYGKKYIPIKALNRLDPRSIAIWWQDCGIIVDDTLFFRIEHDDIPTVRQYFLDKWGIQWSEEMSLPLSQADPFIQLVNQGNQQLKYKFTQKLI